MARTKKNYYTERHKYVQHRDATNKYLCVRYAENPSVCWTTLNELS